MWDKCRWGEMPPVRVVAWIMTRRGHLGVPVFEQQIAFGRASNLAVGV